MGEAGDAAEVRVISTEGKDDPLTLAVMRRVAESAPRASNGQFIRKSQRKDMGKKTADRGLRKRSMDTDRRPSLLGDMRSRVSPKSAERGELTKRLGKMKVTLTPVRTGLHSKKEEDTRE